MELLCYYSLHTSTSCQNEVNGCTWIVPFKLEEALGKQGNVDKNVDKTPDKKDIVILHIFHWHWMWLQVFYPIYNISSSWHFFRRNEPLIKPTHQYKIIPVSSFNFCKKNYKILNVRVKNYIMDMFSNKPGCFLSCALSASNVNAPFPSTSASSKRALVNSSVSKVKRRKNSITWISLWNIHSFNKIPRVATARQYEKEMNN